MDIDKYQFTTYRSFIGNTDQMREWICVSPQEDIEPFTPNELFTLLDAGLTPDQIYFRTGGRAEAITLCSNLMRLRGSTLGQVATFCTEHNLSSECVNEFLESWVRSALPPNFSLLQYRNQGWQICEHCFCYRVE